VLSERELELTGELERLAQRLAAAEAEIDRLHSAPLRGTRTWLRRKLRAGGRPV
jgi:hypothetical protein